VVKANDNHYNLERLSSSNIHKHKLEKLNIITPIIKSEIQKLIHRIKTMAELNAYINEECNACFGYHQIYQEYQRCIKKIRGNLLKTARD